MQHSRSVPRRALRAALGLGAAATASLALASVAGAAVIPITPDGSLGTDHLGAALATANTNSSSSNTIVLAPGIYTPADATTAQPLTISKNLTIVVDHSFQTPLGNTPQVEINGGAANQKATNDLFHINAGVNVRVEGMNIDSAGSAGFATFLVNGTLTMDGVSAEGAPGNFVSVTSQGTATLNDVTVDGNQGDVISDQGSVTLNNDSFIAGSGNGIDVQTPYTLNMNNTLMAFQGGLECQGGASTNGGPGSLDDDGSCGVQYSDDTNIDSYGNINPTGNGGPDQTVEYPAGNPDTTGRGVNCPVTDGRFFVNPVVGGVPQCDIGSVTDNATRETTGPSCSVTGGAAGPPKQQFVTLQDTGSGLGPEPGPGTDNPSNTIASAYPPPAAVPVPGYSVSNLQINNGTVAFTPTTNPSTAGLVLTATKTNQSSLTQWSFTGMNWAGIATNCY